MELVDAQVPSTSRQSNNDTNAVDEQTHFELLVAIERCLAKGPCSKAATVLRSEIVKNGLVPPRLDINGKKHTQRYSEYVNNLPNVPSLMELMKRLGQLSNAAVPPELGNLRLRILNNKKHDLTRTKESASQVILNDHVLARPIIPEQVASHIRLARARELGSRIPQRRLPGPKSVEHLDRFCRIWGHLSHVFCVKYDRTGRYVITGADDNLIKLWNVEKGILRFTFRGHSQEMVDLSVSYCNQLLASASNDKTVRIWSLQTGETLQVFLGHTAALVGVMFLPYVSGKNRYLVSCGNDCQVVFYKFNEETLQFTDQHARFYERDAPGAKIVSMHYSPSGQWVVVGDTRCYLRIFRITDAYGVCKMYDIEAHKERVDSLEWSHAGLKFATGSKDGVVKVWTYSTAQWRPVKLQLSEADLQAAVSATPGASSIERSTGKSKYNVIILCWNLDDTRIVTSGSDHILRVWDPKTGQQLGKMSGHTNEAFVLHPHPVHRELVLSCAHDGVMAIWDIFSFRMMKKFMNTYEHRGAGPLFDMEISNDGSSIAAVDSQGHLIIYGLGQNQAAKSVPKQQFFHTDYMPLIQDDAGWVLDEISGLAPHLMPPPNLTDQDLNVLAEEWQKYVPGKDVENPDGICAWLKREICPKLSENEKDGWAKQMEALLEEETLEFETELNRQPEPEQEIYVPIQERKRSGANARRNRNPPAVSRQSRIDARIQVAIAEQEARRQSMLLNGYNSELDESYERHSGSSSTEGDSDVSSDEDTSDTDFSVGGRDGERERERERNREPEAAVVTSSGRRVQRRARQEASEQPRRGQTTSTRRRRVRMDDESSANSSMEEPEEDDQGGEEQERNVEMEADDEPGPSTGRRRRRQQRNRQSQPAASSIADEEETVEQTEAEARVAPERRGRRRKDDYLARFPDWMKATKRRRFPYIAQLGDKVVYLKQGHQEYLNNVEKAKLYPISTKMRPKPSLDAEEFCIVEEVKYVRTPYRLTVVRLAQTDQNGERTGMSWTVKFHDLVNSPDFVILRHHYDESLRYQLEEGDRIEAILDGQWWTGTINQREPRDEEFPNSHWYSLKIKWETGEDDTMSPWDVQRRSINRRSGEVATEEDEVLFANCPIEQGDWGEDRDINPLEARAHVSTRLRNAIEDLKVLETAKAFAAPVNLEQFDNYAEMIDYPIDLETIGERIRNGFYRRKRSLLQDVRGIAMAAEQFNEPDSVIVRNARVVVEAIVRFTEDPTLDNIVPLYDSLFDLPNDEIVEYRRRQRVRMTIDDEVLTLAASQEERDATEEDVPPGWMRECKTILQSVMSDPTAIPFLKADTDNEAQLAMLETCDLTSLLAQLNAKEFTSPKEVLKKVEELVHRCREYVDDNRSPIYRDALGFLHLFNEKMKSVISTFGRISANLGVGTRQLRNRGEKRTKYNMRSRQTATAEDEPSTSNATRYSQSGRAINRPGFFRDLANGRSERSNGIERRHQSQSQAQGLTEFIGTRRERNSVTPPEAAVTMNGEDLDERSPPRRRRNARRVERADTLTSRESTVEPERTLSQRSTVNRRNRRRDQELMAELQELASDAENDISGHYDSEEEATTRKKKKRRGGSQVSETSTPRASQGGGRYSTRASNNITKRRRLSSSEDEMSSRVTSRRGSNNQSHRGSQRRAAAVATVNYAESEDDETVESSRRKTKRPR